MPLDGRPSHAGYVDAPGRAEAEQAVECCAGELAAFEGEAVAAEFVGEPGETAPAGADGRPVSG